MRVAIAAALTLLPATAGASTYELRDQTTDFTMTIGAPDGALCVAHPPEKRSGNCAELNLSELAPGPTETIAIVSRPRWELTVVVSGDTSDRRGEWTPREARDGAADFYRQLGRKPEPFEQHVIHGVQAFRVRVDQGDTRSRIYFLVGDDGLTSVRFAYPLAHEAEAAATIDEMMLTARARPARSTTARLASSLLTLLAGAPLVLLAAAIASRKRDA